MRYRNAISYAILLVIAYDIKDIANAIKKISHEISLRYRNDAISHAISHLTRIQMKDGPILTSLGRPGQKLGFGVRRRAIQVLKTKIF